MDGREGGRKSEKKTGLYGQLCCVMAKNKSKQKAQQKLNAAAQAVAQKEREKANKKIYDMRDGHDQEKNQLTKLREMRNTLPGGENNAVGCQGRRMRR